MSKMRELCEQVGVDYDAWLIKLRSLQSTYNDWQRETLGDEEADAALKRRAAWAERKNKEPSAWPQTGKK